MKKKYDTSQFIETLREVPFISYAAKKTGIARATIYRWLKTNLGFKKAVDSALTEGRGQLGDLVEMKLVEKIKEKDMGAIKFYLQNNDKRYMVKRPAHIPLSKQHLEVGEVCETCSQKKSRPLPDIINDEVMEQMRHAVANWDRLKEGYQSAGLDFYDMLRIEKERMRKAGELDSPGGKVSKPDS